MKKNSVGLIVGVIVLAGAAAWYFNHGSGTPAEARAGGGGGGGGGKGGRGAQGPTVVNVVTPVRQDVPVVVIANGTVTPIRTVDLRPQTTSTIRAVHIKEGQFVKAGQLMFTLDDRADRANLEKAQAQVARDQATLADLERQYKRSQELFAQKFIAQSAVDSLKSQVDAARAVLKSDMAAAQASIVATSYTAISAPMSGRVGAINVYPGSLVQMSTSLTTITQLDPIDVAFTLPESSLSALLAAQKRGKVEVEARAGADGQPATGQLSFVDNAVDPASGMIRVKAQFANADTSLWPGQYVNARVTVSTLKDAVVIPQNAIIINAKGTYVYVVEADHTARLAPVEKVHAFGPSAAVTGLAGGETIVTEGKQNLRPGGKVRLAGAGDGEGKHGGGAGKRGGKPGGARGGKGAAA
ncbi:efflux RND transporter periplasmic adaptor subunit [Massilia horti]|uniref:Efflux RND transporter periplasmic adaptor subunit n=1 Tax=Massilia horti TaxID=2562153 RepID=A0A4Y9SSY1_9BURK|nr:efflux RND transporter periplasmic adaptor subunit [Massilia horti]TFW27856.1 efflux RND transporter periplasmic adaptor subunit [Massilia horti]